MLHLLAKLIIVFVLSLILAGAGALVSKKAGSNQMFLSPFECGFSSFSTASVSFSSRFFIMALIFLIFDVELILIFPYLSAMESVSLLNLIIVIVFINILSFGLYYEWNFSMMDWIH